MDKLKKKLLQKKGITVTNPSSGKKRKLDEDEQQSSSTSSQQSKKPTQSSKKPVVKPEEHLDDSSEQESKSEVNTEEVPSNENDKSNEDADRLLSQIQNMKNANKQIKTQTSNEAQLYLEKQVRGCINRVSTANLETMYSQLESLYRSNTRNTMNQLLTKCIFQHATSSGQVLTHSVTPMAHSALVSMLHAIIGIEVGAFFVERVVTEFEQLYKEKKNVECSNLIIIITHLYNFETIHCVLIYDLIRELINQFTELDIELLLLLLKNIGPQLRGDDPKALKEIILMCQSQATKHNIFVDEKSTSQETSDGGFNSRAKYMLQFIFDLKNNKQKPIEDNNLNYIKKFMKNYLTKRGAQENPLRVPWSDFKQVETKGRWWLVGSAWSGQGSVARAAVPETDDTPVDNDLLDMARAQRMNTDVRRSIFVAMMSAQDYLDAFERIHKLNLKDKQSREIATVLMHCCGQEKAFNPFYLHLCNKFCDYNYHYKFTFRLAFWDKFKQLHELSATYLSNLAKLLAHLIAYGSLSLTCLKAVEFDKLSNPKSVLFFRIFFTTLLTQFPEDVIEKCFERLVNIKDGVESFGVKEGILHFFFQEEMFRATKTGKKTEEDKLFNKRITMARKALERAVQDSFDKAPDMEDFESFE